MSVHLHADSSKCSGCCACQVTCALYNAGSPYWQKPSDRADGSFGENNPKKAALGIDSLFPAPGVFKVRTCTQCGKCAKVCPPGCIPQHRNGAYEIDQAHCLGKSCLKCVEACPEDVVFAHDDYPAPWKCHLCGQCVQSCGMNVLSTD
jgi:Fe-S-cluster-containing dehydrogenase component